MSTDVKAQATIKVTVTFALSKKPPFRDEFRPSATLLEVRQAAIRYFEISEDPASVYYLSFRRERQDDSTSLGTLTGEAHAAELRLAKETIQGSW